MKNLTIILLSLFLGFTGSVFAQSVSPDSLFKEAQKLAWSGKRVESRELCKQILQLNPRHKEAMLLMARTHAWDKNYREAVELGNRVLAGSAGHYDALTLMIDVESWRDNYSRANKWVDTALKYHPDKPDLYLRKAKLYLHDEEVERARDYAQKALKIEPGHEEATKFLAHLKRDHKLNRIALHYSSSYFSAIYPANHLLRLSGGRSTRYGTFLANINGRYRQGTTGLQYEVEGYPRIKDGMYAWVNFGYSNSRLFPKYRAGAELFFSLPRSFEASAGIRYMKFRPSQVFIFSGSVGKYYKNYWFSARTYITPKEKGVSASVELIVRKYFSHPQNFLTLRVGSGLSPEVVGRIDFGEENILLRSHKVRLNFQHRITPSFTFEIGAGAALRETTFSSYKFIWEFSSQAGIRYNF